MTDTSAIGLLPEWNLGDLYAAPDAPAFKVDMEKGEASAKGFAEKYKGKLAGLSGDELAEALKVYESISDLLGRTGFRSLAIQYGDARIRGAEIDPNDLSHGPHILLVAAGWLGPGRRT